MICSGACRRFFDPKFWRVVLVDQRGCGSSKPLGCLEDNSTEALVGDYETLREHLGISSWLLFGGSWGVTLALAYAHKHPARYDGCLHKAADKLSELLGVPSFSFIASAVIVAHKSD